MSDRLLLLIAFPILSLICGCHVSAQESPQLSLSLDQALDLTITDNLELKEAKAQIERQRGVLVEVQSQLLPKIVAQGDLSKIDSDRLPTFGDQRFGATKDWSASVTANQIVFSGGQRFAAYSREQKNLDAAKYEFQENLNRALAGTKRTFFAVLLAQAEVDVQKQLILLLEEELRSAKERKTVGTVSNFEVLRAEVALANAQAPLIRSRNAVKLRLEELSRQVGRISSPTELPSVLAIGEFTFDPLKLSLEEALETASDNRPIIKALAASAEGLGLNVTSARGGFYPEISGYGGYSWEKAPFQGDSRDSLHGWSAGLSSSWKIFDSFETYGRVSQAQAAQRIGKIRLADQKLKVAFEVKRSFLSLTEASELVHASQKVSEQAEESLRLANARVGAGVGVQLDVLDSQLALTQARSNRVRALHDYSVAKVDLEQAMGAVGAKAG